jgi:hypothetical protein
LIYCPIETSYEYFYVDNKNYKGLRLPKNYNKGYNNREENYDDDEEIDEKYQHRELMFNRVGNA